MTSLNEQQDFDVIVVGAGISGINAAYRVKTMLPQGTSWIILEARNSIGGTWDFFKYPGLRSDSDLYTFGFAWRPWKSGKMIAQAPLIMKYLQDSVEESGIDKNIRFNHRVVDADWSSEQSCWKLDVMAGQERVQYRGQFMILGTGYYDYDQPLQTVIPGISNFAGKVIHPQFWPEELDYTNKKVVVIGSGATAVTIVPNMADKAERVTMVQRSPSYVLALSNRDDPLSRLLCATLPDRWSGTVQRWRFWCLNYAFFCFCRAYPNAARKLMRLATTQQLPKGIDHDPHFSPSYNPWDQRLCVAPNGDFYQALRSGKAGIVTGRIKTVTSNSLMMESGEEVPADILVTATGIKIMIAGGIKPSIDGQPLDLTTKFVWKGVMLQDLPNACFVLGYTNASWTLGADVSAQMMCRMINLVRQKGAKVATPRLPNSDQMASTPMLNLSSTYIKEAINSMPKTGTEGQWRPRLAYYQDMRETKYGDIETAIEFTTGQLEKSGRLNGNAPAHG